MEGSFIGNLNSRCAPKGGGGGDKKKKKKHLGKGGGKLSKDLNWTNDLKAGIKEGEMEPIP